MPFGEKRMIFEHINTTTTTHNLQPTTNFRGEHQYGMANKSNKPQQYNHAGQQNANDSQSNLTLQDFLRHYGKDEGLCKWNQMNLNRVENTEMYNRESIKQGATLRDTVPRVPRSSTTRPTLDQVPSEERTETTVTKRDNPWLSTCKVGK